MTDLTHTVLVRLRWYYPLTGSTPTRNRSPTQCGVHVDPLLLSSRAGRDRHRAATWVDGGLLLNCPITVFYRTDGKPARWPTWGVKLSTSPAHGEDRPVLTAVSLGLRCVATITGDWYRWSLGADPAGRRTIQALRVELGTVT